MGSSFQKELPPCAMEICSAVPSSGNQPTEAEIEEPFIRTEGLQKGLQTFQLDPAKCRGASKRSGNC